MTKLIIPLKTTKILEKKDVVSMSRETKKPKVHKAPATAVIVSTPDRTDYRDEQSPAPLKYFI